MPILHVEKLGGLANYGGENAKIRSHGQLDTATLSPEDQASIEALFKHTEGTAASESTARDGFRYRITRTTERGSESVETPEAHVPTSVAACVTDELV